jgi:anti-sigma factor RsiW
MNNCKSFSQDLDACLDQALNPERRFEIEAHLEHCGHCRATLERARQIESDIRRTAESWQPSPNLWHRISDSTQRQMHQPVRHTRPRQPWRWMSAALLLIAVGVTGFNLLPQHGQHSPEIVASALINEFHTFVASHRELDFNDSQPTEIRNWFSDKVDFRVPLPVRTAELQLTGGRLCNMLDQRIASFMYQADGAWVSLYIRRSAAAVQASGADHELLLDGYGFIGWESQGLHYSLVGDLPVERLRAIAERLRSTRIHTWLPSGQDLNPMSQA